MKKKKNIREKDLLKFMAELEDEARFKLAIAETCGVSPTMIRKEAGGQDTIDKKADKMTLIPEYIFAIDRAIKTILMEKDEDDAFEGKTWVHEENVHHKTRFQYYCDEVYIWEQNKGSVYWRGHNRAWSYWRYSLPYWYITHKLKELLEDTDS